MTFFDSPVKVCHPGPEFQQVLRIAPRLVFDRHIRGPGGAQPFVVDPSQRAAISARAISGCTLSRVCRPLCGELTLAEGATLVELARALARAVIAPAAFELLRSYARRHNLRERLGATAAAVAATEDRLADTFDRLADDRPADASRLRAEAERARRFAAHLRRQTAVPGSPGLNPDERRSRTVARSPSSRRRGRAG